MIFVCTIFFVGAGIEFSYWIMILKCMENFFQILFVHVFGVFSEFLSISLFS
jgi:hypothetical protein